MRYSMTFAGVVLLLLGALPGSLVAETDVVRARLGAGITIDLPVGWGVIRPNGPELVADLKGADELALAVDFKPEASGSSRILFLKVLPEDHYGSVIITGFGTPEIAPADAAAISGKDLAQVEATQESQARLSLELIGRPLLRFDGMKVGQFAGHPAWITRYIRAGDSGEVRVEHYNVFTPKRRIEVSLAVSEKLPFDDVDMLRRVLASIDMSEVD